MAERESLFKRLTRIMKGGVVVRSKIKTANITDRPATSMLDHFNSQNYLYSNTVASYGQYDRLCIALHTKIPVPGPERYATLKELIERYPNGEKFLIYTYDHEQKKIVPAWAHHPRSSGYKDTVKVVFDDNSELICTPDHKCMLRDGTYKEAQDLKPNDSMMPLYRRYFNGKDFEGYASIYTMAHDSYRGWEPEHKLIIEWCKERKVIRNEEHVHHIDHNVQNNNPENLVIMNAHEHLSMHGASAKEQWADPEKRARIQNAIQQAWDNDDGMRRAKVASVNRRVDVREKRRQHCLNNNVSKDPKVAKKIGDNTRKHTTIKKDAFYALSENNVYRLIKKHKENLKAIAKELKVNQSVASGWIRDRIDLRLRRKDIDTNHKIVSIEPWKEIEVGDLTVDGYENFATDSILVHNSRYADFCLAPDTQVYTTRGVFTIKELAEKFKNGERFHVYSYDHSDKTIKIAEAHSPRLCFSGEEQELVRVYFSSDGTLDEDAYIDATPEHKFLLRDGSECKAKDLECGVSLMPFYINEDKNHYKIIYTMNRNLDNSSGKTRFAGWEYEHRLVAQYFIRRINDEEIVHHKDFNKHNNLIENLEIMDKFEHWKYHAQLNNVNKFNKPNDTHSKWMKENNPVSRSDITFEEILRVAIETDFNKTKVKEILNCDGNVLNRYIRKKRFRNWQQFAEQKENIQQFITHNNIVKEQVMCNIDNIKKYVRHQDTISDLAIRLECSTNAIRRRLQRTEYKTWTEFKEKLGHKTYNKINKKRGTKLDNTLTFQMIANAYKHGMTYKELASACNSTHNKVMTRIKNEGYVSYKAFCDEYKNHKVAKVEWLNKKEQVYNLTVDKYHNFAYGRTNPKTKKHNIIIGLNSEMEYTPEISSALDIYCLAGDNIIPLLDGTTKTIQELFDESIENFEVYSYDIENNKFTQGVCKRVLKTGVDQQIYKVTFDDGTFLRLTENHLVLLSSGEYKRVKELQEDDSVRSLYNVESTNHKVVSIEPDGIEDVYDLCVDKWHNFAVGSSNNNFVIVHNSDEVCASDERGGVLHIHSDNQKIKELLENLFFEVLNVEFNLGVWVRNLVKYGDFFLFNNIHTHYGVVNVFAIPVNEIEREEGYDPEDPFAVRFRWVTQGNQILENWMVTHFRLTGNDNFLPYGSSVIESARRIWRQLILIEDAMMVYRIIRSPERRVFYIDVANVPPDDIPTYLEKIRNELRSNKIIDKNSGRVDMRYNALCITLDNLIYLQDSRCITLKELISEWENGKQDHWVYSVDAETKKLVPGKVVWAGITRKNAQLLRVHLDTKQYIDVTPDHKFMLRDGTYCEAQHLSINDKLMSSRLDYELYKNKRYTRAYDPQSGKLIKAHKLVAEHALHNEKDIVSKSTDWERNKYLIVHHRDHCKTNNNPDNLQWIGNADHNMLHADLARKNIIKYNKSAKKRLQTSLLNKKYETAQRMGELYNGSVLHKEHNKIRSITQNKCWNDSSSRKARCKSMRIIISASCFKIAIAEMRKDSMLNRDKLVSKLKVNTSFKQAWEEANKDNKRALSTLSSRTFARKLKEIGFASFVDFKRAVLSGFEYENHSVVNIELLDVCEDTGCITVDKYHNFMTAGSVSSYENNENDDIISCKGTAQAAFFIKNSVDEDYFIPMRGESGSRIETLAGGQFPVRSNSLIPLLDGRTITIKELAQEYETGKENWVYSVQDETHQIVQGKVIWCGKNYTCNNIHRVHLDDGSYVDMAPEHPIVMRDGTEKRADEVIVGESVMPFRSRLSIKRDGLVNYRMVNNPADNEWQFMHRVSSDEMHNEALQKTNENSIVIHHKDFDKLNNNPNNLVCMGFWEHRELHRKHLEKTFLSPEAIAKRKVTHASAHYRNIIKMRIANHDDGLHKWIYGESKRLMIARNKSKEMRKKTSLRNVARWNSETFREAHSGKNHWQTKKWNEIYSQYTLDELQKFCIENNILQFKDLITHHNRFFEGKAQFRKFLNHYDIKNWTSFAQKYLDIKPKNHTITRIEVLNEVDDVYCMTVVGPNNENDRHNFAILGLGIKRDTGILDGIFVKNTGDIEDVEYIQKKLFAALKIPRAYLGYDEDLSGKATLAQEDVRFSRTVTKIQRSIISELSKLAIIHLISHGFTSEDLVDFTLSLSNPSTVAQQQKLELWRTRFEIAQSIPDGHMSRQWVQNEIYTLTKDEREKIMKQKLEDVEEDLAIQRASEAEIGGMPAGGEAGPGGAGETLSGIMGGEEVSGAPKESPAPAGPPPGPPLKAGAELEFDIIAPRLNEPAGLDEINHRFIETSEGISEENNDEKYSDISLKRKTKRNRRRKKGHVDVDGGYPLDALNDPPDLNYHVSGGESLDDPYDSKFLKSFTRLSLSEGFSIQNEKQKASLKSIIEDEDDDTRADFVSHDLVNFDLSGIGRFINENKFIAREGKLPGITTLEKIGVTKIRKKNK